MRKASTWVIHQTKSGWDLSRGGRYLAQGLSNEAECLKRMKKHYRASESVVLEEIDGYRTDITAQLKKSRKL